MTLDFVVQLGVCLAVSVVALPFVVFLVVKVGTYAFLRTRERFYNERKNDERS